MQPGFELVKIGGNIAGKSDAAATAAGSNNLSNAVSDSAAKIDTSLSGAAPDPWRAEKLLAGYFAVVAFVEGVIALNGVGSPDKGAEFDDGHDTFSVHISDTMAAATPHSWAGAGATEYDRRNGVHQAHAAVIARADQRTGRVLTEQASQVEKAREDLALARETALGGLGVGIAYYALCQAFRGLPFQDILVLQMFWLLIVLVLLVFLEILVTLAALTTSATHSERELRDVKRDYESVTRQSEARLAAALTRAGAVPPVAAVSVDLPATGTATAVRIADMIAPNSQASAVSTIVAGSPSGLAAASMRSALHLQQRGPAKRQRVAGATNHAAPADIAADSTPTSAAGAAPAQATVAEDLTPTRVPLPV